MKKYLTGENMLYTSLVLWIIGVFYLLVVGEFTLFQTSILVLGIYTVFVVNVIFNTLRDVIKLQTVITRGIYGRLVSGEGDDGND